MDLQLGPPRRLHPRGLASRGVTVDVEGVALGPDYLLVRRTQAGYQTASRSEIRTLLDLAFDYRGDEAPFHRRCATIAKALDDGALLRAQLLGLFLPVGELDVFDLQRLHLASRLIKYDPDQPRAEDGKWSDAGGSGSSASPAERSNGISRNAAWPTIFETRSRKKASTILPCSTSRR